MTSAVQDLVSILDLELLDLNLFRGRSPQVGWQRVFGGQVIGQALVAACRTVEDVAQRPPHSLHAYFLLGGDPKVPIIYDVDRIRDGKSFTTRRVLARQHGQAIFSMARIVSRRRGRLLASGGDAESAGAGGPAERSRDQGAGVADDARSGAALLRARAADRTAAGRVRALSSARSIPRAGSTSGSAPPGTCPTSRRSINACSPTPPT